MVIECFLSFFEDVFVDTLNKDLHYFVSCSSAAKDHVALTRSTGIYRIIYQQLMENRSAERWLEVLHTPCALVPRLRGKYFSNI